MRNNSDDSSYKMRYVWPEGRTALDRGLAQSRARALLKRLEELELFKPSQSISRVGRYSEAQRLTIHARALAIVAEDRVAEERATRS
jgi:hypothetical protein